MSTKKLKETRTISSERAKEKNEDENENDNYYFTEDVDEAILEYNETDDQWKRSNIYRERIKEPFKKLVEYVVNMNSFDYYEVSKEDFKQRILSHLVSKLSNYDEDKGKAFSYYSFIAYTKGISLNKKNYKKQKKEQSIDQEDYDFQIPVDPDNEMSEELEEFMDLFIDHWEKRIYKEFNKDRDIRIANALIDIFKKRDNIDTFKKRNLYLMIREYSGVEKAQYITKVVKKFKDHYFECIERFKNEGTITPEGEEENEFF